MFKNKNPPLMPNKEETIPSSTPNTRRTRTLSRTSLESNAIFGSEKNKKLF